MKQGANVLIAGLGVMGGSYAMGLTKKGYAVYGHDTSAKTIAWAKEHGIIQDGTSGDASDFVRAADYVVLAMYPAGILPWLQQYAGLLQPGTLVTDLAGVKGCFVPEAQALMPKGVEFIASHPMAGREKSGVQHADDRIFTGANFLIVPTKQNTEAGIGFARELAETLGFGRITTLTVGDHDAVIGYVSQLTHAIAVGLMNTASDERLPEVTGDSFRDLTRIADINDEMWSELFLLNAPALSAEIGAFMDSLGRIKAAVDNNDRETLRELMRQSAERRRCFNAKPKE